MRVILADDHAIVRQGLRLLLSAKSKVEVVGEASNGREALALAEKCKPEAAVLDIAMPALNGLETTLLLKERLPDIKVIILSMHADELYLLRAFHAGACGYVLKSAVYEELILALEAASRGETYLGTGVSRLLIKKLFCASPLPEAFAVLEKVTPREREILQLLAEGKHRQEIARLLSVSPKTVDRHRENLKSKLDIKDNDGFKQLARLLGFVS